MDDNYNVLKLENQLCFPLYACAREMIKEYKPYLDPLGLTYTQYITMLVLWEKKSINVKALGDILYLDSGTLTPLLKKLETKGLITRKRSSEDERNLIVTITPDGEKMKEQAVTIPGQVVKCVNLNKDEVRALYQALYKFLNRNA
ncbi:MAG: MarR family transcriptional regulator [Oscillospiraceae bacterium]|nr:MarR family transcriptional regulator [Oscillospiraceae bacterium]